MSNVLADLLAEREYLIADGATGTNMMARGLPAGRPPDLWNADGQEHVTWLHESFIEAGADIILTNTFGSNPCRLKLDKAAERTHEINFKGAQLARAAADAADRPVVVAGSVGPTGEMMEPFGTLTSEAAEAAFYEQTSALAEGGVDVIWIETIFAFDELAAAIRAGQRTGLPVASTMTFDTASRTMMGDTAESAVNFTHQFDPRLIAFGANCGSGPSMLIDTVVGLCEAADEHDVIIAKGNCGIPQMIDGEIIYSGTNEVMAEYARLARDCGARIIGGCCGTTPERLKAIVDALDGYEPKAPPSQEEIVAALGPIKVPPPGSV
jgi:methionine synthase I (cobalamin-dependent)